MEEILIGKFVIFYAQITEKLNSFNWFITFRRRRRNNGNQSSTDNESLEISANDDSGNGSGDQTPLKTQHNAIPG